MLALARAVTRSLRARVMSAPTTAKFGLMSSTNPFSRSSSYAIVSSDEKDVPAVENLGQEGIFVPTSPLELRFVDDRIIDLAPKLSFQARNRLVQFREIH